MLVCENKKILIFFIVCLAFATRAQVFYSTKKDYLKVKTEKNNLHSLYRDAYPDTMVTGLSNIFPRNFSGNIGLPSPRIFLDYGTSDIGFRFFDPPTDNDRFKPEQVEYYRTSGPYAALTGITGSKQLQAFKLLFTHTYKDRMNITLKFGRYSSMGFYKRQQSYANNFFISSNYTTRNKRFGYYLYILNNGNRNQENGGIVGGLNDSTASTTKDLLPVWLNAANRDNHETKVMINPWFRLNNRPDSVRGTDHYLQLKSTASFNAYRYRDSRIATDNFYRVMYLDTMNTNDSSNVKQFSNELSYSLVSPDSKFIFSAGYKNEVNKVWQKADSLFFNHILSSSAIYRTRINANDTSVKNKSGLESMATLQYAFAGANRGNFKIENRNSYNLNPAKNRNVFFNLMYELRNPDYIYNYWISNHFEWFNNGYQPQRQFQANLGLQLDKSFRASVFYQAINNYLYFDEVAFPRQHANTIANTGLKFEYKKIVLKHLGVSLSYTFQTTSDKRYVRLPQNSATANLFYHGNLYGNKLQLQIGSQVQIYQSFTAYAYMPSTQVFYLQDNFKTQAYPFVDVYINARIKPVSFFLKLENVLNGRIGPNYAFVPGYYQNDLAFRFGLTWMFFD